MKTRFELLPWLFILTLLSLFIGGVQCLDDRFQTNWDSTYTHLIHETKECSYQAIIDYNPGRIFWCELLRKRWE